MPDLLDFEQEALANDMVEALELAATLGCVGTAVKQADAKDGAAMTEFVTGEGSAVVDVELLRKSRARSRPDALRKGTKDPTRTSAIQRTFGSVAS